MRNLRLFLQLSRLQFLLEPLLGFVLGAGIAHYLGHQANWLVFGLGLAWVLLIQLAAQYLNEYHDSLEDQFNPNRTWLNGGSGALGLGLLPRRVALAAALTCLTLAASVTVLLMTRTHLDSLAYLLMSAGVAGALCYSLPPLRLVASGYGEAVRALLAAVFVPAFGYVLQTGDLHRLIAMSTFPAFAAHLAMQLAWDLADYTNDLKFAKYTMMARLGWEAGIPLHNILILAAFALVAIAALLGYPLFAVRAALASFPVGLFQLWQMYRIAAGKPVNWTALSAGGEAFYLVMIYLLALAFWTS